MDMIVIPPSPAAEPLVENHVLLETETSVSLTTLIPRPFPALFFAAPGAGVLKFWQGDAQFNIEGGTVNLAGLGNRPGKFEITGPVKIRMVILKPLAVSSLFPEFASGISHKIECLSATDFKIRNFNEALWEESEDLIRGNDRIENFLLATIIRQPEERILNAINFINIHHGCVSLEKLASQTGATSRHLSRLFSESVGISPKSYMQIIRFNSLMKSYLSGPKKTLESLLFDYQYYDHSHFNKEFKRFFGTAPTFLPALDERINSLLLQQK